MTDDIKQTFKFKITNFYLVHRFIKLRCCDF